MARKPLSTENSKKIYKAQMPGTWVQWAGAQLQHHRNPSGFSGPELSSATGTRLGSWARGPFSFQEPVWVSC